MKIKDEGKEDHCHSQLIKLNNFTVSLLDKRREIKDLVAMGIPVRTELDPVYKEELKRKKKKTHMYEFVFHACICMLEVNFKHSSRFAETIHQSFLL